MKTISTILAILCSACLFAQQRTSGTGEVFENETVTIRDEQSGNVSEAIAVINMIRTGIHTSPKEPGSKKVFSDAEYQLLITKADDFMIQQKYDAAIVLYKEILDEREDRYAKDRLLEAEALLAKQQREEEVRKKDEALYAKAEQASPGAFNMHTVHFSGAMMSDVSSDQAWTSEAFNKKDPYSDFLQPGKYNDLVRDLQKSMGFTLDGIAVPANTRLIVYEKPDFTGEILLDVTGPAIINNGYRIKSRRFKELNSKQFYDALQSGYPQSVRSWSKTNMHTWLNGSMEIRSEQ